MENILGLILGFPCGSAGKEFTCNAGDLCLIPWLGGSPGEGTGYPLQYSGLESILGFAGGSDGKESACDVGDPSLIPGLERSPGEGNGYSLHYSCLENAVDRVAWWSTVHNVAKIWTEAT